MRWRWAGALASATEGRSLPVTTLAQATCPSSVDKDLPVGAAVGKAVGVDVMGQLPGSPTTRLPLSTLPTQAHGQVRAPGKVAPESPDEATDWGRTGTRGA